jgi:hypothetical protein
MLESVTEDAVIAPPTVKVPFNDVLPVTDRLPDTAPDAAVRAPATAKGPPTVAVPEMMAEAAVRELVTTKPPLVVTVLLAYPPKETLPIPSKLKLFTEVLTTSECPRALYVMYFIL